MNYIHVGTPAETHILGVTKLLIVPFPEDSSQFGTIFELSYSSQMDILLRCDRFTSQINNLKGKHCITHIIQTVLCTMYRDEMMCELTYMLHHTLLGTAAKIAMFMLSNADYVHLMKTENYYYTIIFEITDFQFMNFYF